MTATREVTAKFKVAGIQETSYGVQITLGVDYMDERNKAWATATPVGTICMTVKNEVAAAEFTPGRNFLVTFTPED